MSDKNQGREAEADFTRDFSEGKSVRGSGQTIGIQPNEDFVAPNLAPDAPPAETDD